MRIVILLVDKIFEYQRQLMNQGLSNSESQTVAKMFLQGSQFAIQSNRKYLKSTFYAS